MEHKAIGGDKSFWQKKILPRYAVLPIIFMLVLNVLTYNGSRLVTAGMKHYDISVAVDDLIPFVPHGFIIIYYLAYVFWIIGFVLIARENKYICYRFVTAEMIAKLLTLASFLILPTTNIRPEIAGTDICSRLTAHLYEIDAADNLFPSIHCLESWLCFRGAMHLVKPRSWYKWVALACALAIFASTLFLKQHVVLDVIGAVAAVETGILISGWFFRSRKAELERVE